MASDRDTFNLIDEQWVICESLGGGSATMSLADVLLQSPGLRSVRGDVPTQSFAITRILLAIIRRAIDWSDEPVERWVRIWQEGALPAAEITEYLEKVHERFDLLHPTKPFYQVPDLHTAKGEFRGVELLLIDVPPGEKYFTTRARSGTESLSFAEAARWLIHCQAYDISGIKSADPRDPRGKNGKGYPIGVGWCGLLGGTIFEGSNLFETLMLNTVLDEELEVDLPVWEQAHPDCTERAIPTPLGPCDLLTWQSRRIRLISDGNRIVNALVCNGDPISSHNLSRLEHMTGWRYSEPQSKKFGDQRYLPSQWDPNRDLWRNIEGLLTDVRDVANGRDRTKASATAHWLAHLMIEDYLDPDSFVRPHVYGLRYISQSSVVEAGTDETLILRLALLGRTSSARSIATRAVTSANDAVRVLGYLAKHLAQAAGGDGDGDRDDAERCAFFRLTTPYQDWLTKLREDSDATDSLTDWHRAVRGVVWPMAEELTSAAGAPSFIGRDVNGRWLDTATADAIFRSGLRKALPYAFASPPTTEGHP